MYSPEVSSENFKEMLRNDGYAYVQISKTTEPLYENFPNLPEHHRDEFEWRHDMLPNTDIICFEYKGSNYKLVRNAGDADCNDGNFGAVFDANNDKILDMISSGDMETTMRSLKPDDVEISDDLASQLSPYLEYFEAVLENNTEFEYVVFKLMAENEYLHEINGIDVYRYDNNYEDRYDFRNDHRYDSDVRHPDVD